MGREGKYISVAKGAKAHSEPRMTINSMLAQLKRRYSFDDMHILTNNNDSDAGGV